MGVTGEVTQAIATFVAGAGYAGLPENVRQRGRIHILDTLGLVLAGSSSDAARIRREQLVDDGIATDAPTAGKATIFNTGLRAPPRFAAAANAAAAHANNFDDTTPQIRSDRTGGIHASGSVLPAVLALGEAIRASGRDAVLAYHVGVDVASRLNHAIGPRHYAMGFHTTGTMGIFGVVAAAATLRGFDEETLVAAIGLAASHAAGVRRNFGTMAEVLHPAQAAEAGMLCADLAARGATAADDALDGPVGYFSAAADGFDPDEVVGKLGSPWVFEDPGVWIKPHPNGALTHPGAACLLGLLRENGIAPSDVSEIRVRTNDRVLKTLIHHKPADAMQAKFSMEFTLAVIAVEGQAGLGEFTDDTLARADIQAMMSRVAFSSYSDHETNPDFTNVTTLVEIECTDGVTVSGRADYAHGSTWSPMDFAAIEDKFRQCASYGGVSAIRADRIVAAVSSIGNSGSLADLASAMSGRGS